MISMKISILLQIFTQYPYLCVNYPACKSDYLCHNFTLSIACLALPYFSKLCSELFFLEGEMHLTGILILFITFS